MGEGLQQWGCACPTLAKMKVCTDTDVLGLEAIDENAFHKSAGAQRRQGLIKGQQHQLLNTQAGQNRRFFC
jgi:hypothetical protein